MKQPGVWDDAQPTEPGYYWFYGEVYTKESPILYLIRVDRPFGFTSALYFYRDGIRVYPENMKGCWSPVLKPTLPA